MTNRILLLMSLCVLCACHEIDDYDTGATGNFDQLWKIMDEHYCFFEEKGVDWDSIYSVYRPRVDNTMTARQLFDVCADMLAELKDGHTNLSAPFQTSYYRKWWSDYPQNYSARLVEQCYFNFNYQSTGGFQYGVLPENIGYLRYASFSDPIGEGNLDAVLSYLASTDGLIIDVRDNGGGSMSNVELMVARFITAPILAGYISHKTGPGHDAFSRPYAYWYNPAAMGRQRWAKPVVILVNRSTFSAANNFVAVMKSLPNCKIVGDCTGGGSGMPFNSELSNGWGVRFSACPVLDPEGHPTENGVKPSEDCKIDLDPEAALNGRDTMLDFAVGLLVNFPNPPTVN